MRASQGTAQCGAVPRRVTPRPAVPLWNRTQRTDQCPSPALLLHSAHPSLRQGTSQEGLAKALLLGFLGKRGCSSARGGGGRDTQPQPGCPPQTQAREPHLTP